MISSKTALISASVLAISGSIYYFFKNVGEEDHTKDTILHAANLITIKDIGGAFLGHNDSTNDVPPENNFICVYFGDYYSYVGDSIMNAPKIIENCFVQIKDKEGVVKNYIGVEAYEALKKHKNDEILCKETGEDLLQVGAHLEDFIGEILKRNFKNYEEKYILWCGNPLATIEEKHRKASHLCNIGVTGFILKDSPSLSLWPLRLTTGIVIESRENKILVVPIYQGYIVDGGIRYLNFGSKYVYNSIEKEISNQTQNYNHEDIMLVINDLLFFSNDYENDIKEDFEIEYTLKSSKEKIIFNKKKLINITEAFFNPSLLNKDEPGLHVIFKNLLQSLATHAKQLLRAIVVTGKLTTLKGFEERLNKELSSIDFANSLKYKHTVIAAENRDILAWFGAKKLSLQNLKESSLTSEIINSSDYKKHGKALFSLSV